MAQRITKPPNIWNRIKEIDMFFEARGKEHKTLRRLTKRLKDAEISYVIVGGMAINAHKHERTTNDVDVLLTPNGFEEFQSLYVPKDYRRVPKRSRRFIDRTQGVNVDVLVTGMYPGSGRPGPIAYPDPADVFQTKGGVRFLKLSTLVELKLAARRWQDFADVVSLIRANKLDETFMGRLHASVRNDYLECLEEKRREDKYEAIG